MRPIAPPALALLMSLAPVALSAQQCPDGRPADSCRPAALRPPAPNSIAVLPFESRSPDTNDIYVAESMTDEVGGQLAKLARLQVKSHGVVAAAWHRGADPISTARALGVAWILDGNVRHVPGQLFVSVELVRTATGEQVWAHRYQRGDSDLFGAQAEVADSVAAIVTGRLTAAERATMSRRPTRSNEAWRLYSVGTSLMARREGAPDVMRAIDTMTRATRLDPGFALAWARTAMFQVMLTPWNGAPNVDSLYAESDRTASLALKLDSTAAEAWTARANVAQRRGEFWQARQSYERSLALDSTNVENWYLYGTLYGSINPTVLDLPERAIPLFRRALSLDPTDRNAWRWLSSSTAREGLLAEAEARADTVLKFGAWNTGFTDRSQIRLARGNAVGAMADLDAATAIDSNPRVGPHAIARVGLGDSAPARSRLAALRALSDSGRPAFAEWARMATALGLRDEALKVLDTLRHSADPNEPRCAPNVTCSVSLRTWRLLHDPLLAPLHGDPRFEKLWAETMPKVPWLPANEQGR